MSFKTATDARDAKLLTRFGIPVRWTKSDLSTEDFTGILDMNFEQFGSDQEYSARIKTITAAASVLSTFQKGEIIQALDSDGELTGPVYELQDEQENDGSLISIEIIS